VLRKGSIPHQALFVCRQDVDQARLERSNRDSRDHHFLAPAPAAEAGVVVAKDEDLFIVPFPSRSATQRRAAPDSLTHKLVPALPNLLDSQTKFMFFIYMRDIFGDHGWIDRATDV
jgi:hypothetical protein